MLPASSQAHLHKKLKILLTQSWGTHAHDPTASGRLSKQIGMLAEKSKNQDIIAIAKMERASYLTSHKGEYQKFTSLAFRGREPFHKRV